ncbi:MAG: hypothetical protein KDD47_20565, partial [Acidobacteria bacterium]|nr:hypothetical protein [Acidobacteriota bacterium]
YGFGEAPNFEDSHYVLHLPEPVARLAAERELTAEALLARIAPLKARLLAERSKRRRPLTDDKVLADWNGIAIAGLATAGRILEDDGMVRQARRAADFVLSRMRPAGGTLLHSWRGGRGKIEAYLSDYAFLVRGLLALSEATGEARWLETAVALSEEQIRRLRDTGGGFFVAEARPDLLFRSKDVLDGALPSPNAVSALNFLKLAQVTGEERWRKEAEASLKAFGALLEQAPDGLRMLSIAAYRYGDAGTGRRARPSGELQEEADSLVAAELELGSEGDAEKGKEGWRPFRVRLEIAEGWHVNANPASEEFLIPTTVEGERAEARGLVYPEGRDFQPDFAEAAIQVYEGRVEITGEVRGEGGLLLTYQPCEADRCLPPVRRTLPLRP